jgi:hypothetical protein
MISKYASGNKNSHLRHVSVILFHCVGFRKDDPTEISIFIETPPIFRKNLAFSTPLPILNISAPFTISSFYIPEKYSLGTFVTHNKPQLLTLYETIELRLVKVRISFQATGPVQQSTRRRQMVCVNALHAGTRTPRKQGNRKK